MTNRQLNLFKGKNQRGTQLPAPKEDALQYLVAEFLRKQCRKDWRWLHIPLGGKRDISTAVQLKRMGVSRGWPDLAFFRLDGTVCFIELKRRGGVLSDDQQEIGLFLTKAGHGYLVTDNFDDVREALRTWGVTR